MQCCNLSVCLSHALAQSSAVQSHGYYRALTGNPMLAVKLTGQCNRSSLNEVAVMDRCISFFHHRGNTLFPLCCFCGFGKCCFRGGRRRSSHWEISHPTRGDTEKSLLHKQLNNGLWTDADCRELAAGARQVRVDDARSRDPRTVAVQWAGSYLTAAGWAQHCRVGTPGCCRCTLHAPPVDRYVYSDMAKTLRWYGS